MKKQFSIRFLSVLLSMILVLSIPLAAYAETEGAAIPEAAEEDVSAEEQGGLSFEDIQEMAAGGGLFADDAEIPENAILLEGEDGEDDLYLMEITEDEDPSAAEEDPGYDTELLEQAMTDLAYEDNATDLEKIEAVYEAVLYTLPEDTALEEAAAFVGEMLEQTGIDYAIITGTAGEEAVSYVIVRFEKEGLYYILDPAADLADPDADWTGFLLGSEDRRDWTADEEFRSEEFIKDHPISKEAYKEPDEESQEDPYEEESEDPELEVSAPETEDAEADEDLFSADPEDEEFAVESEDGEEPLEQGELLPADASKKSLSKAKISLYKQSHTYTGKAIKASVLVKYGSKKLKKGTDYKLSYKNNVKVGTATVTITGINKYRGTVKKTFKIVRKSIKKAKVTGVKSRIYTGKAIKLKLKVQMKVGSKYVTLKRGTDYSLRYLNNKNPSTSKKKAKVIIMGKGNYKGELWKTFIINKRSIKGAKVTGVKNRYVTGKAIKLSLKVKVKIGSKYVTLKRGRDYSLKYTNNKKASTSKVKARVYIRGKGGYKDKISRSFKILKRNPKLKFSPAKATRTARSAFTKKVKKGVSAKLTITYSSSNKSVATVNKKTGKVTPKKVGTTKITARSKATGKYKAGKATYTLKIRPYKFKELNYSFANYSTSYIPESTFRIFFSSVEARSYYNSYYDAGRGGVCFGMSASSQMFNAGGSKLSKYSFRSSADRLYDLSLYDTYRSSGITLKNLIEAMFLSQICSAAQSCRSKHVNDYAGLVKQIRSGKPCIVSVRANGGGHAIVGYKVSVSSSYARVYVYDCNHPTDSSRYITLYRSGNSYTGWSYNLGNQTWSSSIGGNISYYTTAEYKKIWKNRKGSSAISKMLLSSDNFEIRDAQGELVASMVDGEFSSSSEDIQMLIFDGEQPDTHLIYVPVGAYSVTNTSPVEKGLEITALNVDQSITVSTESDTVLLDVNDETGVNKASFAAEKGDAYEVSLMSELPSAEGKEEVSYSGIGTGSEVTLGMEEGACIIEDAEDVTLEVNGEEIAYVVFNGEAVIE